LLDVVAIQDEVARTIVSLRVVHHFNRRSALRCFFRDHLQNLGQGHLLMSSAAKPRNFCVRTLPDLLSVTQSIKTCERSIPRNLASALLLPRKNCGLGRRQNVADIADLRNLRNGWAWRWLQSPIVATLLSRLT
jgi:hypothetical protein